MGVSYKLVVPLLALFTSSVYINWSLFGPRKFGKSIPDIVIWPVGDSITYGAGSTTGNGYRQDLLDLLSSSTVRATYTGSLRSGTMQNKANDGHGGQGINNVSVATTKVLQNFVDMGEGCPDLMLLHVGTNDCNDWDDVANAPARLGALLDRYAEICPRMPAIVAKIIRALWDGTEINVKVYNQEVPGIVQERVENNGRRYLLVDMYQLLEDTDYLDFLHPRDVGYKKIAKAWYGSILEARDRGWI